MRGTRVDYLERYCLLTSWQIKISGTESRLTNDVNKRKRVTITQTFSKIAIMSCSLNFSARGQLLHGYNTRVGRQILLLFIILFKYYQCFQTISNQYKCLAVKTTLFYTRLRKICFRVQPFECIFMYSEKPCSRAWISLFIIIDGMQKRYLCHALKAQCTNLLYRVFLWILCRQIS